jgi:hypothetical protein
MVYMKEERTSSTATEELAWEQCLFQGLEDPNPPSIYGDTCSASVGKPPYRSQSQIGA